MKKNNLAHFKEMWEEDEGLDLTESPPLELPGQEPARKGRHIPGSPVTGVWGNRHHRWYAISDFHLGGKAF